MEGGNRRPFGGLQAFINNGFDFDQVPFQLSCWIFSLSEFSFTISVLCKVITITDEDLENLPLGETVY
jgi:hypothetical protein